MDPNLYGKKKKKNQCPNPLFVFWLTKWMNDAKEKGLKSSFTYKKALNTLKKYPATLQSGKECKFLENFGDKICQMLDKELTEYVEEFGTTEPIPGVIDLPPEYKPPTKKRKNTKQKGDTDSSGSNAVDAFSPTSPGISRKRSHSGSREYLPLPGTGPYALVITLYNNQLSGQRYNSKIELMREAQRLCEKSFTTPEPGCRYTAWSSMGTLIKKGYIVKESNPAKYSITDSGCELALKLLGRDERIDANRQRGTNVYDLYRDDSSPPCGTESMKRVAKSTTAHAVTPPVSITTAHAVPPPASITMSDDEDSLPAFPTMMQSSSNVTESKFNYIYIDDEGIERRDKDKAAVLIDDTLGIGFLVKCKYEDLLLSGKRYQIDTSKVGSGDCIFAYLHNDDAADFVDAPKAKNHVNKDRDKVTLVSTNTYKEKTTSLFEESLSLRERIKMSAASSNMFPFSGGSDIDLPSSSHKTTKSKESSQNFDFATKSSNGASSKPQRKYDFLHEANNNCEKRYTSSSSVCHNLVSNSSDSQTKIMNSEESVQSLSDMSQETIEIDNLEPLYILRPNSFDIVLIVDTHEHYGQGIPKTLLIPELRKYSVLHDIRPLQVGDFTWIAREKGFNSKRKVVLDYIVERKRMDDLAGSITDGRFREQKFRMCNCGVQNGIYLVEDYGSVKNFSIPEDTLHQTVANTQIIDSFHIKRTKDTKESVAYLSMMTRYLQSLYADKTLAVYNLACLKRSKHKNNIHDPVQKLVSFQEFNESSVKTKALSVQEMFAKLLVQVQGMTQDKAAAIIQVYTTPAALYDAYSVCSGEKERDTLLSCIKYGTMQKKINDLLSKQIHTLFCKQTLANTK